MMTKEERRWKQDEISDYWGAMDKLIETPSEDSNLRIHGIVAKIVNLEVELARDELKSSIVANFEGI